MDLLERMEPRLLLSNPAPLPTFADFEDPDNPALRLTTQFGEIDFELFAHQVPELVSAFISGLERGVTSDQTFFHRLIPGVVLQGGLFAFDPDAGIGAFPANLPLDNPVGSGRANTERTVAIGTVLDSGVLTMSSFIINLTDNTEQWDPTEAVVFARVIDDRSWDVVQMIASLDVADLTLDASFVGFFAGSFHDVPVTGEYIPPDDDQGIPGTPITPELLAGTYDLAMIRAPGATDFYRYALYEPEGFLHSGVREFVPIENPHDEPVYFELNARFEAGESLSAILRDDLVIRGMIPAHSRGGVTVRIGGHMVEAGLRHDEPFALELRSTLPLAASLSHYDLGSSIAMPFSGDLATTWFFPRAASMEGLQDFIVWYNPGNENSTVSVTLIAEDGSELDPIVFETERFRRGGINFQTNDHVPDGVYAVRIDSTEPITVSRSHYANSGPPRSRPEGYSETGATGEPSEVGIVAWAADPGDTPPPAGTPTITLNFFNPSNVDAVIQVTVYEEGSTVPVFTFPSAVVVPAGRTGVFDHELPQTPGAVYSLSYHSSAPVYAGYAVQRYEGTYGGAVPIVAANEYHFAEGFTDPGRVRPNVLEESIHLFNANGPAFGIPAVDANVTITFRFNDGFELSIDRMVAGGTFSRLHISTLEEIIEQGVQNGRFFYSIEVSSDVPIVAQMLHTDVSLGLGGLPGGGFILSGTIFGETRRLDDPGPF